jgi:hypothetical protein
MSQKVSYISGLDLGQMADYSALAVAEVSVPDEPEQERNEGRRHYFVQELKRWDRGTPYTQITEDMVRWYSKPPSERYSSSRGRDRSWPRRGRHVQKSQD